MIVAIGVTTSVVFLHQDGVVGTKEIFLSNFDQTIKQKGVMIDVLSSRTSAMLLYLKGLNLLYIHLYI